MKVKTEKHTARSSGRETADILVHRIHEVLTAGRRVYKGCTSSKLFFFLMFTSLIDTSLS